ncbi:MAG: hypothetical protein P8X74_20485 [Reinekea sp.]
MESRIQVLTWAFLQLPTIGGNYFRKAAHNAGWWRRASCWLVHSATGLYNAPMIIKNLTKEALLK